jgi:HSP20 family molecular chaperone IbpA
MSLFSTRNSSPFFGEFAPMFRLMDDYATHVASKDSSAFSKSFRTFTPKFDVKENKDNYELHGELPGIDQKNINIEFSDPQTLTIKGRTEHHREEGTRPTGLIEGEVEQGKLTEGDSNGSYHKPSVEDESGASTTQVQQAEHKESNNNKKPESRYWISERSVGEFARTFAFPSRVDQDNVKASLKDGILSIVIPKAQAPVSKRITIE